MNTQTHVHPNTPARLRDEYERAKGKDGKPYNMRALAEKREVNIYFVSRAIRYGERPANKRIAKRLYFEPKTARQPLTDSQKWWRYKLDKWARNAIVERLYNHAQEIDRGGQ